MANKQHAQFSDENGNLFYLENQTEDVLDPSGKPLSDGGDLSEASVKFSVDTSRKLPQSGGRFKAFLGSIVKYLTDLGAAAYLAVANNDTTTQPGFVGDARVLKQHRDAINQLNSDLTSIAGQVNDILHLLSTRSNPYVVSATRRSQSGVVAFTYGELNCEKRPSAIFVTTQSFRGSCQYDYENSSDGYVRLYFWDADGNTPPDSDIDFCIAVYP